WYAVTQQEPPTDPRVWKYRLELTNRAERGESTQLQVGFTSANWKFATSPLGGIMQGPVVLAPGESYTVSFWSDAPPVLMMIPLVLGGRTDAESGFAYTGSSCYLYLADDLYAYLVDAVTRQTAEIN